MSDQESLFLCLNLKSKFLRGKIKTTIGDKMAKLDNETNNLINMMDYKAKREIKAGYQLSKHTGFLNLMNKVYGGSKMIVHEKAKSIIISDAPREIANKMIQDVMLDFDIPSEETVEYIKAIKQGLLVYAGVINREVFTLQQAADMVRICCMAIEFNKMMSVEFPLKLTSHHLFLASERFNILYAQED